MQQGCNRFAGYDNRLAMIGSMVIKGCGSEIVFVRLELHVGSQIVNSFVINKLKFIKVPPGALLGPNLFVFNVLKFKNWPLLLFYNIFIVKQPSINNIYIVPKRPPRGVFRKDIKYPRSSGTAAQPKNLKPSAKTPTTTGPCDRAPSCRPRPRPGATARAARFHARDL
jgi:hypothetical protein